MDTCVEHELDDFVQQDTDGGDSHPVLQHTDRHSVSTYTVTRGCHSPTPAQR
jgi:hypothetical protein